MPTKGVDDKTLGPESDWLKYRLRVRLLADNPYFQKALQRNRQALGLAQDGFPNRDAALDWLYVHLTSYKPHIRIPEEPLPDPCSDNQRRHVEANTQIQRRWWAENWLRRETASFSCQGVTKRLPLLEQVHRLETAFCLPHTVFHHLTWYVLIGKEIPETAVTTVCIEEIDPGAGGVDEAAVAEAYWSGLPDIPGTLVVIKVLVNAATGKQDLAEAWEYIKQVRAAYTNGKQPGRRRAGKNVDTKQIPKWLSWYHARRVEGKSLEKVAYQFDVLNVETIRYAIHQLDELMKPKNTDC